MSIFKTQNLDILPYFTKRTDQLAIVERASIDGADRFFQKLLQYNFAIAGQVRKDNAVSDIKNILKDEIPKTLRNDHFYGLWIHDMARVCVSFCCTQDSDAVGFWLGSERGCRRYHIDNVPLRALVTYAGTGTEYLPDEAANLDAYAKGASNDEIVKDPSAIRFMKAWDVAVFRGGPKGLLHRTPNDAIHKPSILMRLDHPTFWDRFLKRQENNSPS